MSLSDCQRVVHSGKLYDVTSKVHIRTGHGGRDKVLAAVKREYYGVTQNSYVSHVQPVRRLPQTQSKMPLSQL